MGMLSILPTMGLLLTSLVLIAVPVLVTQRLGLAEDTANGLYGYAQGIIATETILAGALSKRLHSESGSYIMAGCALCVVLNGVVLHVLQGLMAIYIVLVTGCGLLTMLSTVFQDRNKL